MLIVFLYVSKEFRIPWTKATFFFSASGLGGKSEGPPQKLGNYCWVGTLSHYSRYNIHMPDPICEYIHIET